jgi:hypothetical protein
MLYAYITIRRNGYELLCNYLEDGTFNFMINGVTTNFQTIHAVCEAWENHTSTQ